MPTTNIIDVYYKEALDLEALKAEGIVAIIHKVTQGTSFKDPRYKERKKAAKDLGFLWGGFHFATAADWEDQVEFFLATMEPEASDLVSWDWERPKNKTPMTLNHTRDSVSLLNERLGRFPILYAGSLVREEVGDAEDPILKHCPLWYARYRSSPLGVPTNTWPTYTLWQYTAGEDPTRNPPGPVKAGGEFVDRNLYQGTDSDLRVNWPFT